MMPQSRPRVKAEGPRLLQLGRYRFSLPESACSSLLARPLEGLHPVTNWIFHPHCQRFPLLITICIMKTKPNREDYQFRKKTDQELIKLPGQLNGLDFLISNCENCVIWICDHTAQVFVDLSKNCKVFLGPVSGPVFVRKCENIEISAASSQFRMQHSSDIKCFIFSASDPALEKCTNIQFAPFNFTYPHVTEHFGKANLDLGFSAKWSQIFDFTPNFENRNWGLLNPSEYKQVRKEIEAFECEDMHPVPIPQAYGGTCTRPIVVGSEDANSQEKGGKGLDFVMGKENVQRAAKETSDAVEVVEEKQDVAEKQVKEVVEEIDPSVRSDEAQENIASVKTFSAFDDWIEPPKKQAKSHYAGSEQNEKERAAKELKRQQAREFLEKFKRQWNEDIEQRRRQNRLTQQEEGGREERQAKGNPWQFITKNIDWKNQKGEKDVEKMAQAILRKAKDN